MRIITDVVDRIYDWMIVLRKSGGAFGTGPETNAKLRALELEPISIGDVLEVYVADEKEPDRCDSSGFDVLAVIRDGKVLINRGVPELGPPGSDAPATSDDDSGWD